MCAHWVLIGWRIWVHHLRASQWPTAIQCFYPLLHPGGNPVPGPDTNGPGIGSDRRDGNLYITLKTHVLICQIPKGPAQGSLDAAALWNWRRNQKVRHLWEIRPREVVIKHHLLGYQTHGADTGEPESRDKISLNGCYYDNEVFRKASPPVVPQAGPECKVPSNAIEQSEVNWWTHGRKRKEHTGPSVMF